MPSFPRTERGQSFCLCLLLFCNSSIMNISEKLIRQIYSKEVNVIKAKKEKKVSLIPLGGLGEIGKNMMVVRYGDEMLIIDSGLMFPEDDLLGIDLVIPDITFLVENRAKIKGIVITHGHEDHIGALPYVLREISAPVFGTKLALGLIQGKLKEASFKPASSFNVIKPEDEIQLGCFKVEFFRVCHSIPDAIGLGIHTPLGLIVHSGDFKFDPTPVDGESTDFHHLAKLGKEGVLVLLSDSTNVERRGFTQSERVVGQTFQENFGKSKERIIVASFASNVHRVQQVIDAAHKYERKVAIAGRSMVNVVNIASELGYLTLPEDILIDLNELSLYPRDKVVLVTTGTQGEPMSALSRMATGDHRWVKIQKGDTVIISSTPIPGNEKLVSKVVDQLFKLGADVIYGSQSGMHVSGHASREELKIMLSLVKPKYFIPVHGEYRMLIKHAQLAEEMGVAKQNIFVAENGDVLDFTPEKGMISGKVSSGRVLIDGLGVGDVGNIVLRDRRLLSQDGIMIVVVTLDKASKKVVAGPDVVSRGFVYVREAEDLMQEAKQKVASAVEKSLEKKGSDWTAIKTGIRDSLGKFLYEKTKRRPVILPIIMEI